MVLLFPAAGTTLMVIPVLPPGALILYAKSCFGSVAVVPLQKYIPPVLSGKRTERNRKGGDRAVKPNMIPDKSTKSTTSMYEKTLPGREKRRCHGYIADTLPVAQ